MLLYGAGHCNERAIQDRCAQIPPFRPSRQYDDTRSGNIMID